MQSFDTKDSNTLESFDRKFERFDTSDTKDSEVKQPGNDFLESFDRKFRGSDTFDTKDSELDPSDNEVAQSFDRKFEITDEEALSVSESFGTKDSEVKQSDNDFVESLGTKDSEMKQLDNYCVESFDRKFEGFDTKDSEVKQSDNEVVQSFDQKFEITDEEALPDSESFDTNDSNVSIPNFDKFNANSDNSEQSCRLLYCTCSRSEKSKADGRRKPRSQKQIEAYKRNFSSRKSVELRINELDLRVRHLQSSILSLLRRLR